MDNVIANIKVDTTEIEKKINEIANERINEKTKTHPRMYSIGTLTFNNLPEWSGIDVPVSNKTDILRAIEEAGYSITYTGNDTVSINAIKKQLQHDA